MKKNKIKSLVILGISILLVIPTLTAMASVEGESEKNDRDEIRSHFTSNETQQLDILNTELASMPLVLELKKEGKIDEYVSAVNKAYQKNYRMEMDSQISKIQHFIILMQSAE